MRVVWTVAGDDPDIGNCKAHGITGALAPMFDTLTTKTYVQGLKSDLGLSGLYLGHGWLPGSSPQAIADAVNGEFKRVGADPALRVMFNMEEHDPNFIASTLEAWRRLRPTVNTTWSPEGMQGGWMGPKLRTGEVPAPGGFIARVLACRVRVVPQAFVGNMARRESDIVLRDLTQRGIPESSVSIFYDAAQLGVDWDGFAFTEGRLPRII